jgi:hypothetical protein
MARFILRQPIRFVEGTGFTIDNGNEDIVLRENTTVTFNIGQDVSTNQNVIFNAVTSSLLNINDSTLRFTDSSISGSTSITADFVISNNLIAQQNIIVAGQITAEEFLSDFSQSTTIFKSGSTQFGDTGDDVHGITGSLSVSGSFSSDGFTITEISNDTALTDGSSEAVITENALKTYLTTETEAFQAYLRKSFAHTGSFVNSSTSSFTAVTASAPSGIATTTVEDFMFFNNGAFMETDALTIQQSGSKMFLLVNTNSIGYDLTNSDEIVAFGKFNS